MEKEYLYWLSRVPLFGAVTIRKLWEYCGSFSAIYNIEESRLEEEKLIGRRERESLRAWKPRLSECIREYQELAGRKIRFITPLDEDYPKRLLTLYDYPMGLYVRGELPKEEKPVAAIVGARGCTEWGRQIAEEFARSLSAADVQVISGLALGIDGAAHRGALRAGYPTFGVLGCGVNICYPPANYRLFGEMLECGGILSEFGLGESPQKGNFPMRNRIISGLSDVVLVVEAREKSGSLITAELGLEQGREIFAVPGRITDSLSGGCNRLISQGAGIALSPEDILEYLGIKWHKKLTVCEKNINRLAKKEKMVYSCLDFSPKHLDEIIRDSGLSAGECMGLLLELELGGYVVQTANQYYGKII